MDELGSAHEFVHMKDDLAGRWGQENREVKIFLPPFSCQFKLSLIEKIGFKESRNLESKNKFLTPLALYCGPWLNATQQAKA